MLDISGIKRLQFDVLVIGAGGAGLSAAIAASQEEGIRVGSVSYTHLTLPTIE